jgi:hypothetical protein
MKNDNDDARLADRQARSRTLTDKDFAALQLAIAHAGRSDRAKRNPKLHWLEDYEWIEAGLSAAYSCQWDALQLKIDEITPCFILDPDEVLAIPQTRHNHGEHQAAQLLKQMLACSVSRYHPDPVAAIADANRRKARRSGLRPPIIGLKRT